MISNKLVCVLTCLVWKHAVGDRALPRFKSPVLGRRLRALVGDEPAGSGGSMSCPGSPRDISRLSAALGRRLQLGLSPRLCARRTHRRSTEPSTAAAAVDTSARRTRQVHTVLDAMRNHCQIPLHRPDRTRPDQTNPRTLSETRVSRPPVLDCGTTFHLNYGGRDLPSTPSDSL